MKKSMLDCERKQEKEIKSPEASKIKHVIVEHKTAISVMILGAAMMIYGIWRGEMAVVCQKAIQICLECIGIG